MMKKVRGLVGFLLVAVFFMSMAFNNVTVFANNGISSEQNSNKKMIAADGSRIAVLNNDGTVMVGGIYGEAQYKAREWTDINTIYVDVIQNNSTIYGITSDGRVKYTGASDKKRKLDSWTGVVSLSIGDEIMGLRSNGTVYNTYSADLTDTWTDIVDISQGVGLKKDGTVVLSYYSRSALASSTLGIVTDNWRDIAKIYSIDSDGNQIIGLKKDGTLVYTGFRFSNNASLRKIDTWTDIVDIDVSVYGRIVGLKKDGSVVIAGKGYTEGTLKTPIDLSKFTDMKSIAVTENFLIGIKNDGTIIGAGSDKIDEFIKSIE